MTGLAFIIVFLSGSGFWFILFASNVHSNYHDICILDQLECIFGKTLGETNSVLNTSFPSDENEEKLGKVIGKCYLDPLCFKLENPQNTTR